MEREQYPYFLRPMISELAETTDSQRALTLRRRIAANVGDSDALSDLLGLTEISISDFYGDANPDTPGTEDTIEIFLRHFGKKGIDNDDVPADRIVRKETAAHNESDGSEPPVTTTDGGVVPIQAPAIDYASMILDDGASADDSPSDETASAIDSFLKAVPPKTPKPRRSEPQPATEPTALTESFARILIKNRNYSKALDIIKELNLKNPEKSIYFADQIRFLEKLILNEQPKKDTLQH